MLRKRALPPALRIHQQASQIALVQGDDSPPTSPEPERPPSRTSMRNKRLSITIPALPLDRPRKASVVSVVSLPPISTPLTSVLHRKEEDGGVEQAPYADGPVEVIPGIWIGSEENARDWQCLSDRGIRAILNVAKEVFSPFDNALRSVSSTPNFRSTANTSSHPQDTTYYPPHKASGRPGMHYLKLQWSHGQQDLVNNGFQAAMAFVDNALARSDGVLVHCQCGISRSATMVIALVMRAAAERSRHVPPEVWALKGMQGAYTYVKEKSPCVGPNMSLIYQLLDYEKTLRAESTSDDSDDSASKDEEWGRRRQEMEENSHDESDEDLESSAIMQEARALDKAMEDRIVARNGSTSSLASTSSRKSTKSGIGMGLAWRDRYDRGRGRKGSVASSANSIISEDLVEVDEEEALLGVGGGFDSERPLSDGRTEESSASNSPDDDADNSSDMGPFTAKGFASHASRLPPPSAPAWKTSFHMLPPPPATAVRSTFDLPQPPAPKPKARRRPASMSISVLPVVPSSPIIIEQASVPAPIQTPIASSLPVLPRVRKRTESNKLVPPPLFLRSSTLRRPSQNFDLSGLSTPSQSQTLFVFPPSPTLNTRTPSTMTLMSEAATPNSIPFPSMPTPRISTFRQGPGGRRLSFVGTPSTPTVGTSRVDARGYFGQS